MSGLVVRSPRDCHFGYAEYAWSRHSSSSDSIVSARPEDLGLSRPRGAGRDVYSNVGRNCAPEKLGTRLRPSFFVRSLCVGARDSAASYKFRSVSSAAAGVGRLLPLTSLGARSIGGLRGVATSLMKLRILRRSGSLSVAVAPFGEDASRSPS